MAKNKKIDGYTFKTDYVMGLKSFDQFYEAYKASAYTEDHEKLTDDQKETQKQKLQKVWELFHPVAAQEPAAVATNTVTTEENTAMDENPTEPGKPNRKKAS